jgi:hypothetical protein
MRTWLGAAISCLSAPYWIFMLKWGIILKFVDHISNIYFCVLDLYPSLRSERDSLLQSNLLGRAFPHTLLVPLQTVIILPSAHTNTFIKTSLKCGRVARSLLGSAKLCCSHWVCGHSPVSSRHSQVLCDELVVQAKQCNFQVPSNYPPWPLYLTSLWSDLPITVARLKHWDSRIECLLALILCLCFPV